MPTTTITIPTSLVLSVASACRSRAIELDDALIGLGREPDNKRVIELSAQIKLERDGLRQLAKQLQETACRPEPTFTAVAPFPVSNV